jgi:hypothetical protein
VRFTCDAAEEARAVEVRISRDILCSFNSFGILKEERTLGFLRTTTSITYLNYTFLVITAENVDDRSVLSRPFIVEISRVIDSYDILVSE